jgi:nitrate/nitrite transporter NarK
MTLTPLQRRLLPFLVAQAGLSTLVGFGTVLVYAQAGMATTVAYILTLLTCVMLGIVVPYAVGRRWTVRLPRVAQLAFALPALLLPWSDGRPMLLAIAVGGFIGLSWAARHRIELGLIDDHERDGYAANAIVLSVLASLGTTAIVSLLLTWSDEARLGVLLFYAAIAVAGLLLAVRGLPETEPLRLENPRAVLRQRGYRDSLLLYLLQSGLFGIGLMMSASGAIEALGKASHYGWSVTAATLVGAAGLWALRHRRHAANRDRTMAYAVAGIVVAQLLLGASAWLPALFVLHLLTQAAVQPFWQASEQVLNQRAMDIQGALVDRIAAREVTLWAFRVLLLGGFWLGVHALSAQAVLAIGATLMALSTALEYAVGRAWLRHAPAAGVPAA